MSILRRRPGDSEPLPRGLDGDLRSVLSLGPTERDFDAVGALGTLRRRTLVERSTPSGSRRHRPFSSLGPLTTGVTAVLAVVAVLAAVLIPTKILHHDRAPDTHPHPVPAPTLPSDLARVLSGQVGPSFTLTGPHGNKVTGVVSIRSRTYFGLSPCTSNGFPSTRVLVFMTFNGDLSLVRTGFTAQLSQDRGFGSEVAALAPDTGPGPATYQLNGQGFATTYWTTGRFATVSFSADIAIHYLLGSSDTRTLHLPAEAYRLSYQMDCGQKRRVSSLNDAKSVNHGGL